MKNGSKKTLAFAGLALVLVLLFLFMRKNPGIIKRVENALAPITGGLFSVPETTAYTPHDYPTPPIDNGFFIASGCNFCSKTSSKIAPASPPITASPPANVAQFTFSPQPFGGAGTTAWFN